MDESDRAPLLAFVSAYTHDDEGRIASYRVDRETGHLETAAGTPVNDASFMATGSDERHLYATHRGSGGALSAFRIDPGTGGLDRINRRATGGDDPTYVGVDGTGDYAFVAHADGTVTVLPIGADGSLDEPSDVREHEGSSVDPERQQEPHPHSVEAGPRDEVVYVPDLGVDRVVTYRLDRAAGILDPGPIPDAELQPGAGPRHIAFDPDGRYAYVINELDSTLTTFGIDPQTGALDEIETTSTLPEGFDGDNYCADVHVHPSGRWVYGSNRGHDSVAIFAVDGETGRIRALGHEPTGGNWPRDFAVDPDGSYLYAENQRSDSIVPFAIDNRSGHLTHLDVEVSLPNPVCMVFVEAS